jgi:hypothetical protein
MATIAYTSGAPNPKVAQSDITLAQSALPVANQQLFGDAEDVGNAGATFTWKWYLLDKPSAATTAFIDPDTTQNPLVGPFDVWGNYLFLLVATSNMAGGASEGNRLKAPQTAFVQVRVQSNTFLLEKPAKWARKWTDLYRTFVDKFQNHTILEHVDVATATGAKLDKLCDGSLAEDPVGVPMHVHGPGSFTVATTAAVGTVKLRSTPVNALAPVVLNREPYLINVTVDGSTTEEGFLPMQVVPQPLAPNLGINPHAVVVLPDDVVIQSIRLTMVDGGDGVGDYEFAFYKGSSADWSAGTPTLIAGANILGAATGHNIWFGGYVPAGGLSITPKNYLGIVCVSAPEVAGGRLNICISAEKSL